MCHTPCWPGVRAHVLPSLPPAASLAMDVTTLFSVSWGRRARAIPSRSLNEPAAGSRTASLGGVGLARATALVVAEEPKGDRRVRVRVSVKG